MRTAMTLLSLLLTASVQVVAVDVPCGSLVTFSGRYEGDLRSIHRVGLEAFDAAGHVTGESWIEDYYVPADEEQIVLLLGPGVKWLRTSALGPGLAGAEEGHLLITFEPPELRISARPDGTTVELQWLDGPGCWQPQKLTPLGWVDCGRVEAISGDSGYFRLALKP